MTDAIIIDHPVKSDAGAIADLCGQLGYPQTADDVEEFLTVTARLPDHAWYVARLDGKVVGYIHMEERMQLVVPRFLEVVVLVVDETCRSKGIGRLLMKKAEEESRKRGMKGVFLYSNIKRHRAHQFYANQGFMNISCCYCFEKRF